MNKKWIASALAGGLVVGGALVLPAQASEIAEYETQFATDFTVAGISGMRNLGTGSIELTGVSGSVTRALLYWHGPTNSEDPAANAAVTFASTPVTGSNIGFSGDNNWGFENSQAYRADVTSLVTGNGTYALADFTKDDAQVNGASLIVFYDDGDDSNNRDVVIFDGNDSNQENPFDGAGWNVSLAGIDYDSGSAGISLVVSDGQNFLDDAVIANGTELAPSGPVFQGDTLPSAGTDLNGLLWDQRAFDITSLMTPGENTVTMTSGINSDLLSLIVAMVDLPAGSAPNQPTTTTSSTTTTAPSTTTTTRATTTTTAAVVTTAAPKFTG